jgi:uncharacterized membrane protein YkoI
MQKRIRISGLIAAVFIAGALSCGAEDKEEIITLANTPVPVQETIKKYATESQIKRIEKGEEDGKTVYEVAITKGGKDSELTISRNGKLLSVEEIIALADVPKPAQKTINTQAGSAKIETVEKVTEDGKVSYEATFAKGEKKIKIAVAANGRLLETEDVTGEKP